MITITTSHGTQTRRSELSPSGPTVFVVHDDLSVRDSLESCIDESGWDARIFASAEEFLAAPRLRRPSCLVLDVALPDLDGLDLQQRVAAARPDLPIIFITACRDVPTSVRAMKAGAIEFLTTPVREDVLLAAIADALDRSARALEREARMSAVRARYATLTTREREVMVLVAAGLLNKQVGGELGISVITVKAHRGQVMRKMRADSLPALVHMVTDLGPEASVRCGTRAPHCEGLTPPAGSSVIAAAGRESVGCRTRMSSTTAA